ncbi:MAG: hypothetical protein KDA61_18075, partial [Planctomycetales bacterium]|nr:hypothetical protein [Planctomycetales bacterium]
LIAAALGGAAGKIVAVNAVNRQELQSAETSRKIRAARERLEKEGLAPDEVERRLELTAADIALAERRERPFLSSNDRSRWLAIRALVELGQFEIDPLLDVHLWNTIDMVKHTGRDGQPHLYSSKPPLLYVLLAGEYWLVHKATGLTLADSPYAIGRLILLTFHLPLMLVMLWTVCLVADRYGTTDWGRLFVAAAGAFGTLFVAFVPVLNNHLPAATATAVALYAIVRIVDDRDFRARWFWLAGLAAAFAAANELPALALLAGAAAWLFAVEPKRTLQAFAPAAAIVVVAFFATNYWAHQSWRPPYMHRSKVDAADNWYDYEFELGGRVRESYWRSPQGVDRGEPNRLTYAIHSLVGHHGIFSLTPIWALSVYGMGVWLRSERRILQLLAASIAALTMVCLVFYLGLRPQVDRNYGGMTSGFRWMFWFAPLWLVTMVPAADRASQSRWGQSLACVLLAFSAMSAAYPTWNPWSHPWIYHWMTSCGWTLP